MRGNDRVVEKERRWWRHKSHWLPVGCQQLNMPLQDLNWIWTTRNNNPNPKYIYTLATTPFTSTPIPTAFRKGEDWSNALSHAQHTIRKHQPALTAGIGIDALVASLHLS